MGSPFPGMDPYIEQPRLWSDFHSDLAGELRAQLNRQISPRYFARLTPYETYETVEVDKAQGFRPDLGLYPTSSRGPNSGGLNATVTPPTALSSIPLELPLTLYGIEVRLTGSEQLVTAIEILSPVNKRPGHEAHTDYLRKRRDLLRSAANFIEIDLLRAGQRAVLVDPVPPSSYFAMVSREELRPQVAVWAIGLADPLPVLPVPLLAPDEDARIDLASAVAQVYERGAYAAQIDYREPPPLPVLSPQDEQWIGKLLVLHRQEGSAPRD